MVKLDELFDSSKFVKRNLPEQVEFEEVLKNEIPTFFSIIEESFIQTLNERAAKKQNSIDKNWLATTMSGNIKGFLIENYPENVKIDSSGRFYYKAGNKYLIYFKKLNDGLYPSNIKTKHFRKLIGQFALPLEQPLPIIFLGYTTNKSKDLLTGCYAVCIKDQNKLWVTDLSKFNSIPQHTIALQSVPIPEDLSSLIRIKHKKTS